MKIGSPEHRDTFCRHFMQTYTEFDPDTLPWPDLALALGAGLLCVLWSEGLKRLRRGRVTPAAESPPGPARPASPRPA